ncbi:AbrB/MazE/SpoVT family DNA-binding domain-containing protein [Staphylococcus saprophyticus]|uniref:AbrB/MazE/SpoVT family DNA-binding domain-containing protein n=1 Tax=Mammaliicoccus sciuri TaxID=1296 RepID=A0A517CM17_MAMSC|nr:MULTISPECIES: AbrB/MazE/SpoVT family DNA-binding domain-containing protein [Staphylococcaceae]MCE5008380.1 AbrB/MazE/SpoVT family DNA-binding domain-containing protein [Staphylococcus equorum]MDK9853198.1 AbrB/MazE/SpoVT family DNA-binding domain-containing protein [Staphylococcus equorum]QDR66043.1 AbrB/MazE/SpoVT family DNA-binding domain-containing protein [Mammaliicoccus sciuri]
MGATFKQKKTIKPEKSTVKKRGQITIPKNLREELDLHEDDQLEVSVENGKLVMQPVITIAKDQSWFWSPEWQKGEREAEENISNNEVKTFNNAEDAISFLRSDKG